MFDCINDGDFVVLRNREIYIVCSNKLELMSVSGDKLYLENFDATGTYTLDGADRFKFDIIYVFSKDAKDVSYMRIFEMWINNNMYPSANSGLKPTQKYEAIDVSHKEILTVVGVEYEVIPSIRYVIHELYRLTTSDGDVSSTLLPGANRCRDLLDHLVELGVIAKEDIDGRTYYTPINTKAIDEIYAYIFKM